MLQMDDTPIYLNKISEATSYIQSKTTNRDYSVGIVCGSGLSILTDSMTDLEELHYVDIPGFSEATVAGHVGKLSFGFLNGKSVICMKGRFHFYEGHSMNEVTFPVRVLSALGIKNIIITNAAGGLNPDYSVGDVVVINDHISIANLAGNNPLRGPNLDQFGTRFPSVSDAYCANLRSIAFAAHKNNGCGITLREGIYSYVCGPSYESRTEGRFLRMIGADVVGMSTVPEVIVAKHCGLNILTLSLVSNMVLTKDISIKEVAAKIEVHASHQEVLDASKSKAQSLKTLVYDIVGLI